MGLGAKSEESLLRCAIWVVTRSQHRIQQTLWRADRRRRGAGTASLPLRQSALWRFVRLLTVPLYGSAARPRLCAIMFAGPRASNTAVWWPETPLCFVPCHVSRGLSRGAQSSWTAWRTCWRQLTLTCTTPNTTWKTSRNAADSASCPGTGL